MADVRALLKAKRQEARISHPYASYTAAGQLKCTVCSAPVKHASAWEGHLGSKAHRTNVIRMREEEERQRRQAALKEAEVDEGDGSEDADGDGEMDDGREESRMASGKRRASEDEDAGNPAEKKRKVEAGQSSTSGGFPQDFFSDPSRGPVLLPEDDDDDDEGDANGAADASTSQMTATAAPGAPKNEVDLEYERFQRELLTTAAAASSSDKQESFQRATVFAEPVAASADIAGFPPANAPEPAEAAPQEVTEEEARQKKEQEERELIMDRLLEEERAQEDADTKVQMLKNRIEALRKKREQAKAKKATAPSKAS